MFQALIPGRRLKSPLLDEVIQGTRGTVKMMEIICRVRVITDLKYKHLLHAYASYIPA